jgi:hypothetical protein
MVEQTRRALAENEIKTEPVRLQFPSLFVKRTIPGSTKETFQAVALIPPNVDLKPFKDLIKRALVGKFGDRAQDVAKRMKSPIHDATEKAYDGYLEGWHFINLNANFPPKVVDQLKNEILDSRLLIGKPMDQQQAAIAEAEGRIYPGCWVRFHLDCYAWDHKTGGKGVSFGMKAVQLVRDDEPFSTGGGNSADVFDVLDDESNDDDFDAAGPDVGDGDNEDWLG